MRNLSVDKISKSTVIKIWMKRHVNKTDGVLQWSSWRNLIKLRSTSTIRATECFVSQIKDSWWLSCDKTRVESIIIDTLKHQSLAVHMSKEKRLSSCGRTCFGSLFFHWFQESHNVLKWSENSKHLFVHSRDRPIHVMIGVLHGEVGELNLTHMELHIARPVIGRTGKRKTDQIVAINVHRELTIQDEIFCLSHIWKALTWQRHTFQKEWMEVTSEGVQMLFREASSPLSTWKTHQSMIEHNFTKKKNMRNLIIG